MRCLVGSLLLMLVASGCANQLALSELSARNTVPPPGTQSRAVGAGSGYYNPLALFQANGVNSGSFTPPAPTPGFAATPAAPNAETTSPFWNLPTASPVAPAQPAFTDRWASRSGTSAPPAGGSGFGSISAGPRPIDIPPPQLPAFGPNGSTAGNFGANNFGTNNFGTSSFGNSFGNNGAPNRGFYGFGGAPNNGVPSYGTNNGNPIGNFFNQLFNGGTNTQPGGFGSQPNWAPPQRMSGSTPRPNTAAQAPAPRFDFGAPRATNDGEPGIKISDSALRELPRNPRNSPSTPDATRAAASPATPLARQPAPQPNNLPSLPASARPLPKQDGEYIEISRLPAAPNSAT